MNNEAKVKEIWRPVKGFPDYSISSYGRIKTKRNKINRGWDKGKGYRNARLYKNKKHKNFAMHRLVALHFIPNPENKRCVNHIDSNPSNNHVSNLEWCTHKENSEHAASKGRYKGDPTLVLNTETGIFYESIKKAAKTIDMPSNGLVCRLMGRTKNNTAFIYA